MTTEQSNSQHDGESSQGLEANSEHDTPAHRAKDEPPKSRRVNKGEDRQASRTSGVFKSEEQRTEAFWQDKYKKAHDYLLEKIVTRKSPQSDIDISPHYPISKEALGDYVTLDWYHREDIRAKIRDITEYVNSLSRRRPLNIIMQAEPGSGKSHFIKCLAKRLRPWKVEAVTFNMATMEGVADILLPLDAVRNLKVGDACPLLFLDEFDSNDKNTAILLPLLWDGELHVGHRDLNIGKAIIVLAGSQGKIRTVMESSRGMRSQISSEMGKLVDLLSRVNGGALSIPGLDGLDRDFDRRVDKVCMALSLLAYRFGDKLEKVPLSLLSFISQTQFRYGVRSISHIVDAIRPPREIGSELLLSDLSLPLSKTEALKGSSLAYHIISEDGPAAVVELWRDLEEEDVAVRFRQIEEGSPFERIQRLIGNNVDPVT